MYHLPFIHKVKKSNFFRDIRAKVNALDSIKYTIKSEFIILKINGFFSLEILKKVVNGHPFVSSSLQTEGSKSNFFRDIRAKVNSLDSTKYTIKVSLIF